MLAGFYEIEFTPTSGNSPGDFIPHVRSGSDGGLFSNVAAFTNGGESIILISIDILSFHAEYGNAIRKRISEATGVAEKNIFIAATHTHAGPALEYQLWLCPPDIALSEQIADKTVEAAILAWNNRKESKLGVGTTYNNKFNFCRDYYMANGDITTNPGYDRADLVEPIASPDHSVNVMRVDDMDGHIKCFLVNYANHPCCGDARAEYSNKFSADYPGFLRRALKKKFGEDVNVLFFTGAAGDVNCFDFQYGTTKIYNEPGTSERRDIGESLADDVEALNPRIFSIYTDPLIQSVSEIHRVARRKITSELYQWALENAERAKTQELSISRRAFTEEYLEPEDPNLPDTVELEIHTVQIGPWAMVGLPGEIYTEIGKRIKANSPYPNTVIVELANGTNGYIMPDYVQLSTAYEARFSKYNSFTGKGTADTLINESVRMLNEMNEKNNLRRFGNRR